MGAETVRRAIARRSPGSSPNGGDLRISYPRAGRVGLVSGTLFADPASPACRQFVGRVFSVPEIESVVIRGSAAEIRYAPKRATLSGLVRRIAAALRSGSGAARSSALYLSAPAGAGVQVRRHGAVLSTWELRHALP